MNMVMLMAMALMMSLVPGGRITFSNYVTLSAWKASCLFQHCLFFASLALKEDKDNVNEDKDNVYEDKDNVYKDKEFSLERK